MSHSVHARPVILLVDDNPHDVVLIRLAFRKAGIIDAIRLVKDGVEAIHYLQGSGLYADRQMHPPPTLVLLDLHMPQASGFEVLLWIRKQLFLKDLKVVVMTGAKDDRTVQRAYDLGADSYLVKPGKFADLVRMMETLKTYCSTGFGSMREPVLWRGAVNSGRTLTKVMPAADSQYSA